MNNNWQFKLLSFLFWQKFNKMKKDGKSYFRSGLLYFVDKLFLNLANDIVNTGF